MECKWSVYDWQSWPAKAMAKYDVFNRTLDRGDPSMQHTYTTQWRAVNNIEPRFIISSVDGLRSSLVWCWPRSAGARSIGHVIVKRNGVRQRFVSVRSACSDARVIDVPCAQPRASLDLVVLQPTPRGGCRIVVQLGFMPEADRHVRHGRAFLGVSDWAQPAYAPEALMQT